MINTNRGIRVTFTKLLFLGGLSLCLCPVMTTAASLTEMEQRLEFLETEIEFYLEEAESKDEHYSTPVLINGYVDTEYQLDSRPGKNPGFRLHHLSLFFKKQIAQKRLRLVQPG